MAFFSVDAQSTVNKTRFDRSLILALLCAMTISQQQRIPPIAHCARPADSAFGKPPGGPRWIPPT